MLSTRTLPVVDVAGSHREIGRAFGEHVRDQTREYSEMWLAKAVARSGKTRDELLDHVAGFVQTIDAWAPYLGDEIRGVAEGTGIDEREAFAIQVRMELLFAGPPPPSCTTFALTGEHTATREPIVGQNVDLDAEVERFGVILKAAPEDSPAVMMYTSPGLVSYVGLNDAGLSVHGNLLVSDGWRAGFPRYLLTRVMLRERSVAAALEAGLKPPRASSRNLILGDAGGAIANVELAVQGEAVLRSEDGVLVHANHFTAPELAGSDRFVPESSCHRQERMRQLLDDAPRPISVDDLQGFYRDHDGYPGSICAHQKEGGVGKTVASLISEPAAGRLHASFGSPCEHEYALYTF
jgi:isopenicillin-N N-acyltransferase-like protein